MAWVGAINQVDVSRRGKESLQSSPRYERKNEGANRSGGGGGGMYSIGKMYSMSCMAVVVCMTIGEGGGGRACYTDLSYDYLRGIIVNRTKCCW